MLKVDFRPQKDEVFDIFKNRDFRGGASASAEKILEFEGAKSSFQKGLGSKSRFLEK